MSIEIFAICWNEELLLPQFYDWYKTRFPSANFTIYDNMSDDGTLKIAKELGIRVIPYNTGGQLKDSEYLKIKNNCWKGSESWVIVADIDEWLNIDENLLISEAKKGTTLIKSCGYNMCNVDNCIMYKNIKHGHRSVHYDKVLCFNSSKIKEINYSPGAHSIKPVGDVKYSTNRYDLLHMKFLNEDYIVNRYRQFKNRMSIENKNNGWGIQYLEEENKLRETFRNHLKGSSIIYEQ